MQTIVNGAVQPLNNATSAPANSPQNVAGSRAALSKVKRRILRILQWPARIAASRRARRQLSSMTDFELRDIGLNRSDIMNVTEFHKD